MNRYRFSLLLLAAAPFLLANGAAFLAPRAVSAAAPVNPAIFREPAPELTGNRWLNVTGRERPSLTKPKAKVTVVHFWTFG